MEKTAKAKQGFAYFCGVFVVVCCVSRSLLSWTRSNVLYNFPCRPAFDYDSNLLCIVFLVTKSPKVRCQKEKRLEKLFKTMQFFLKYLNWSLSNGIKQSKNQDFPSNSLVQILSLLRIINTLKKCGFIVESKKDTEGNSFYHTWVYFIFQSSLSSMD